MSQPYLTVWDGTFLHFRERVQALADQAAGHIQVFEGPNGYQPGFTMLDSREFPLVPPEEPEEPEEDEDE